MSSKEKVFQVDQLVYRYNEVAALDGITLSIDKGQRIAVLGANGSGKSTLLRLLDGLYFPQSGTIEVFGNRLTEERLQDINFAHDFRRRVAFVFQNPDVQLFCATVFDEVAFGPLQLHWPKDRIKQAVKDTLDLLEISHLQERAPHRLSGGEKKRVALASVLVLDPEVLLLDEPTAALDPRSQSQVIDFLIGWSGGAKTVITATHELDIVEDIADYCFIFQRGKILTQGKPEAILKDEEMLFQSNLVHAHRHTHSSGETHTHPHRYRTHQHNVNTGNKP